MIELEMLHNGSLIGITLSLPKTRILLVYHTKAVLVSEPFCLDSDVFDRVNVLYVDKAESFDQLLKQRIRRCRLLGECTVEVGMMALEALEILQE